MQSRGTNDQGVVSPPLRLSRQQRLGSKQGSMEDLRSRPELSPRRKIEGSGRLVLFEGKDGPSERRKHGWHLGAARKEKIRQGSPRQFLEHESTHLDNPRKNGNVEYNDYENPRRRAQSVYRHGYHGEPSKANSDDYVQSGIHSVHDIREQKSLHMENKMTRRSHMLHWQMTPTSSSNGDDDAPVPWASLSREFQQFEDDDPYCTETRRDKSCYQHFIEDDEFQFVEQKIFHYQDNNESERLCYRDSMEHELLRYKEASEHQRFHCQEPLEVIPSHLDSMEHTKIRHQEPGNFEKVSYRKTGDHQKFLNEKQVPAYYSKNIARVTRDDDFPCSSSGVLRCEYTGSCEEVIPVTASRDYSRSSMEFTESENYNNCDQRTNLRDITSQRLIRNNRNGHCRSTRFKHDECLDFESREHVCDDNIYHSEDISRQVIHPCDQLSYEHVCGDLGHGESFRSIIMHPEDRIDHAGGSLRNVRASIDQIHRDLHEEAALERHGERGVYSLKRKHEHPCLKCFQMEAGITDSRDNSASSSGITKDHNFFVLKLGNGFRRDSGPHYSKDRLPDMPMHDSLEFRRTAKRQKMPDSIPTINYPMEEDIGQHDTRIIFSRDSVMDRECEDYDNEWTDEYADAEDSCRHNRSYLLRYPKRRMYDEPDQPRDSLSEVQLKFTKSPTYQRRNPDNYCKPRVGFMSNQHKSSSLRWNKSYQTKGNGLHRLQKIMQNSNSYDENAVVYDDDPSDGFSTEPSEESDEFKQLVNEAFLTYSKSLNLHPALQRRYKEQGKAGSLFCIVCGRRLSKMFMDTRRLVTHAFMSHKVGMRAKHLGLHKAICVLMGWNTRVPCDTITWVPEVLPDAEALAQKEDLILWPPLVIIHNISMSNNNPESQRVIPAETVASFLRGKGFADGKMKIVLGKPADQSIILLKFLGTFTGLSSAERIHKYFTDINRGRVQLQRDLSSTSSGCGSSNVDVEAPGDKIMEQLLYGHLGIADDLDRLDSNTKHWISIKSKKEIQDLADAPVKTTDV